MTDVDTMLAAGLGSAAQHASRNVPTATPSDTAEHVLDSMRGRTYDSASVVAVLDGDCLRGLLAIEDVLAAPANTPVQRLMDPEPPIVAPSTAQERAAWAAIQRPEPALAVVDDAGTFQGLVPARALVRVLLEEHEEDMVRLSGYLRSASPARMTTVEPVRLRLLHRLPWLLVGLFGALLSAGVVGSFEAQLAEEVLIAFFVPGIVYMADAIGTQTEALVIRGLSLGVSVRRIAVREMGTGVLLGVLLGALSSVGVGLLWDDWEIALAVGTALLAAASIATAIALALPWLINRMGIDPAFGSGPLATVIQDLLTVTIYLAVASAFAL